MLRHRSFAHKKLILWDSPVVVRHVASEFEDVKTKLSELAGEGRTEDLIELVLSLLMEAKSHNTRLEVRLQNALRKLYGRSSEKISIDQLAILFEAAGDVPEAAKEIVAEALEEKQAEAETKTPPIRPKNNRSPLPDHLPREERIIQVPEGLRVCDLCGAQKKCMGHKTSEILEFVPASFKVIIEKRETLVCKKCESGVVTADSEKVMDKGRPGPGLLAHLLVSKGEDSLPIYRQAKMYERSGVTISASTLGEWMAFGTSVLEPLARHITRRVLKSFVIGADDTGIRVLDRDHPNGVKRGHLWCYIGDASCAFDFTPTWEAAGPTSFLKDFEGFLQGDGYAGFNQALAPPKEREEGTSLVPDERRLGCGMHIRRKFEEAAHANDTRGAVALAFFKKLYSLEASFKEMSDDERLEGRQELSLPILDELYLWIHSIHRGAIPGTPIYKATHYAIAQERFFRLCFSSGCFEIDNGRTERELRRVAIGRKNYLFAGSDDGAHRLAVLYTVLASAKMNGLNPLAYMTDVITKLQSGLPMARLDELLPHVWGSYYAAVTAPTVVAIAPAGPTVSA